jgi:hypothetical protein
MPAFHHHPQTISESESHELALDSYVLYAHTNTCVNCGNTEKHSEIYEVWLHPTKTRNSNLRDLRPVGIKLKDLPIYQVAAVPRAIPICTECAARAPREASGRRIMPISREAWAETLKRKYAAPAPEPKVARTTATPSRKVVPTLDQI